MIHRRRFLSSVAAMCALPAGVTMQAQVEEQAPGVEREFRGAWIASVANLHWPSKPGLSVPQMKQEMLDLLDFAASTRLNAIILQVRPAADAVYRSSLEPWSEYLTGKAGQAPSDGFDPLAFAVEQAHRRGLELHAWFNPYRAGHRSAKSPAAASHVSRKHPTWVVDYNGQKWMDPGVRGARDHVVRVVSDVVRRYDIDGVHLDDYFYPYPEKNGAGAEIPFPDGLTFRSYRRSGGKLALDDWRRDNVNGLVRTLAAAVKSVKPWVRFGISPFGIWRPGQTPGIVGFDAFAKLYADARAWIREGWVDYLAPQLYWRFDAPGQYYPALLEWWRSQNPKRRHIWPGLNVEAIGKTVQGSDILRQIELARSSRPFGGVVHWNIQSLRREEMLREKLLASYYTGLALTPELPWRREVGRRIGAPTVSIESKEGASVLRWQPASGEVARFWIVQMLEGKAWRETVLGGEITSFNMKACPPRRVLVHGVDRYGRLGPAAEPGRSKKEAGEISNPSGRV